MTFVRAAKDGVALAVRVTPKASRDAINGVIDLPNGPALKIAVGAPPDKGKANTAVCELIAEKLGLPKSAVTVMSGATDRRKVLHITGDAAALMKALLGWIET